VAGAAALPILGLCVLRSSVLGWEDHLARLWTRAGIEGAIRLAPGDARNYDALTTLDGPDRLWAFERSIEATPYNSKAWIALGLEAELDGDRGRAERWLLRAARVDRTYGPRWSLANFYFRAGDRARFWPWLREAARMSYGDPRPLAELAWNMAEDAPEGLAALVGSAPALESYVAVLLDHERPAAAEAAAQRLIETAGREAAEPALAYSDRFLQAGRPDAALRLWNRMAAARLVPTAPLDAERGPFLSNGDFAYEPLNRGFDWRPRNVAGVSMFREPAGGGMRFIFSGGQPEYALLMFQFAPLEPGHRWRFAFEYRTEGLPGETGVRWRTTGAEWQAEASDAWREGVFEFSTAPDAPAIAPLTLAYDRAPGTVRQAGSFELRRARLEPAP
jgi:pentatricopeptide repeat protein